jgi:single-stranded-DNA-specific exonuclease
LGGSLVIILILLYYTMRWRVLKKIEEKEGEKRREEIIQALFLNRGLKTKKEQEKFLNPKDPYQLTPQEVGISSVQLIKALKRIKKAIKKKEKVIVYGDYDTDGVCATAIMWETLNKLGVEVMPYIPKREEGYGLKVDRIDEMVKEGVALVITVDQGIVHSRQVAHAKKLGIDTIITDHHQPGKIKPRAAAIIHTTQMAGAGVSWFLANWLIKKMKPKMKPMGLDLATIGTVTDMVPLVGPNRSLVKFGLESVRKTKRPGLLSLFQFAGIEKEKIGTYEIGFIIGPRINASGRMDDAMEALRLVCTPDENRAVSLAQKIDQQNRERQELMKQTTLHARNLWLKEDGSSALIFVYHQSYEHGVVGLVASKLKDEFYRPAVVLAPREDSWVASARSVDGFSIIEAIREFGDLLGDHGGHRLAAGFSVSKDKLEEVKKGLIERAEENLQKKKLKPTLEVEAEVELSDLTLSLYQEIEKLAPFGVGNPRPILASRGVGVSQAKLVGRENKHLKLMIEGGLGAIGFGLGGNYSQLASEKPVDIAYEMILNQWNGQKKLELRLRDIKLP